MPFCVKHFRIFHAALHCFRLVVRIFAVHVDEYIIPRYIQHPQQGQKHLITFMCFYQVRLFFSCFHRFLLLILRRIFILL